MYDAFVCIYQLWYAYNIANILLIQYTHLNFCMNMSIVRNTQGKTAGVLECVSLSLCILDFLTLLYKGGFICSFNTNNYLFTVVGSVWEYFLRGWKEIDLQEKASYSFGIINVSFSVF